MKKSKHSVFVSEKHSVDAHWLTPNEWQAAVIIAHGAGQDMHSEFISVLHEGLAERGLLTVKFNFPYMQQGRKAPDRAPILEATWQAVIEHVLTQTGCSEEQLFLTGKSMGGRYASIVAEQRKTLGGLVFFGYPLHPPGKPEQLRAAHLHAIRSPMLFIQGARDNLCRLEALRPTLDSLTADIDLHIIEGGDHSFKVLKRLQRPQTEVYQEIIDVGAQWIMNHC